jgi:hypothetical protein
LKTIFINEQERKNLMAKFDPHQNIIDAINNLFPEPCVAEVRILKAGKLGTVSGYFKLPEHIDEMVAAVEEHDGAYNVYWTINPVHPDLLARAYNRTKPYQIYTTEDRAVIKRNWLPIDIDPVRYAGISSSDEEKAAAKLVMFDVVKWLTEQGWPLPVKATSGNGYHIPYRIDLPNNDDSMELVKGVLSALAARFDNDRAHVDTTLYNASRILKAYGTKACKGDDIPERPHRYAQMTVPASPLRIVTVEQLQAVAALALQETKKSPSRASGDGSWTKELVESGLKAAKFDVRSPLPFKGGLKWQHCCWSNPDHQSPDAFSVLDSKGWVSAKCSHNSCPAGLNSREWVDVMEQRAGRKIEKPRYSRKSIEDLKAKFEVDAVDDCI